MRIFLRFFAATAFFLTSVQLYSQGSLIFDGVDDYVTIPDAAGRFNPGTGDYTAEAWVWYSSATTSAHPQVFLMGTYLSNSIVLGLTGYKNGNFYAWEGMTSYFFAIPTTSFWDKWTHFAVVRSGGVLKLYVNGVAHATTYNTTKDITNPSSLPMALAIQFNGTGGDADSKMKGNITNFRFTKSAVYTTNFTPLGTPLVTLPNTTALLLTQSAGTYLNATNSMGSTFQVTAGGTTNGAASFSTMTPFDLVASTASLSQFNACSGISSSSQTFDVSGKSLTANVVVSAPAGFEVSTNGTFYSSSVTLTQSGGSLAASTIHARMASASSSPAAGSIQISSTGKTPITVGVSGLVDASRTWTGSGNWSNPSNWTCGSIPVGGTPVTIASGTVTVDLDADLGNGNLVVNSGAVLKVAANATLTVDGVITNQGEIELLANSSQTGQLWIRGSYSPASTGIFKVNRTFDVTGATNPWLHAASPVAASMNQWGSVSNLNMFSWNAGSASWNGESAANMFIPGKGYAVYLGPNGVQSGPTGTLTVQGVPNTTITPTFGYNDGSTNSTNFAAGTSSAARAGWNLVGNPFTTRLDFTAFRSAAGGGFNNSFARWNPNKGGVGAGGFDVYAGASADYDDASIPVMGAAWVQTSSSNAPSVPGGLNASNHGRRTSGNFSKGGGVDKLKLTVSELSGSSVYDDLSLAMVPGASSSFDADWDGRELINSVALPNLFVSVNEDRISAKAVDFNLNSTQARIVVLGVLSVYEMRPYRLHLDETWTQPGYTVYLRDLHLNQVHNLSTSDYVFAYTSAMEDRFELILTNAKTGALGLEEASRGALTAWVSGSELWITGLESGAQEIDVVGMDGRVVLSAQLRAEEGQPVTTSLPELPAGLYTVRVRANGMERGVRFAVQR